MWCCPEYNPVSSDVGEGVVMEIHQVVVPDVLLLLCRVIVA